jgi:iodotyrosine deiodinase
VPQESLRFDRLSPAEQARRSTEFLDRIQARRTVREFSSEPVDFALIENAIRAAASAPSGANQQPWRFVVIQDPEIKRQIRIAAEEEERFNYEHRFPEEWLEAPAALGTDWHKLAQAVSRSRAVSDRGLPRRLRRKWRAAHQTLLRQ